jgi:chemotaxis protein CheC
MNQGLVVSNLDEQRRKVLMELTEQALSESSSQISLLGQKTIRFTVNSITRCNRNSLYTVFEETETNMVAVCQRLDMLKTGHILFMLAEASAVRLTKILLNERHQLKEMTEMEEESLTEVGNIIINNCLRNFIKIFHESVSGLIPTFTRGHYAELVNILMHDTQHGAQDIYLVKFNIEIGQHFFTGFILWLGHLCQLGEGPANSSVGSPALDKPV